MSFLRAEWRKLALANYEVDPEVLQPFVPAGTELDLWQGRCYVSLVGFMFLNTRVLGLKVPGHVHFEEVNLRFYVKRMHEGEVRRGVVFIKEIVPLHAITWVANTLYKEHYQTLPMNHQWVENSNKRSIQYQWKLKSGWQSFSIDADIPSQPLLEGSEAEFITEHYWGYSQISNQRSVEYQVTHPRWQHYPVQQWEIQVDFGATYGPHFHFLNTESPTSAMLAEGSSITVEKRTLFTPSLP
ncbi:MAG TPA: hypothetical protein DCE41_25565 [Cytophagales bacterium]|nr:hypothetical protein [Cytophagales bacterium]HAA19908.1 hypothetical protein [Cytophagales bacterium]HAP62664.1 hypothetical protein [Cytophagales bacterium]